MRLLTRSDFDGLICAVLLREAGIMTEWKFVHPKDLQDGKIEVGEGDVLANVPYVPGCGLWFDHHSSEEDRLSRKLRFEGAAEPLPSCARVIWNYYGGADTFPERFNEMMDAVDKCDSGNLTEEDIMNPKGWVLLSFVMDPRTGLGRYRDYSISNYQLMERLIEHCRTLPINEILDLMDVKERLERYFAHEEPYKKMLRDNAMVRGPMVIIDLRDQEEIFVGNRFMVYVLYPECNISLRIIWGLRQTNTVFTMGRSILNRTATLDIGRLMLRFGGGGHRGVGTCQVDNDKADAVLEAIIEAVEQEAES
ncbi:exopolyphosphatase [Oceanidesulfovibrio indonesiensis]|uniref:Exopolyphosphatase n=1 Tax=Oceanidesulfovibrio indonesiensis TaxID=54767 RepID=A0A7M3MGC9_9BACT|nr:exopolyphosphatase [Oceanidesulfovibrio indonesiensis]TVM18374.1 exopolyphosphatase [Oceanidesulfovibrio indonesiensis]